MYLCNVPTCIQYVELANLNNKNTIRIFKKNQGRNPRHSFIFEYFYFDRWPHRSCCATLWWMTIFLEFVQKQTYSSITKTSSGFIRTTHALATHFVFGNVYLLCRMRNLVVSCVLCVCAIVFFFYLLRSIHFLVASLREKLHFFRYVFDI